MVLCILLSENNTMAFLLIRQLPKSSDCFDLEGRTLVLATGGEVELPAPGCPNHLLTLNVQRFRVGRLSVFAQVRTGAKTNPQNCQFHQLTSFYIGLT